MTFNLILFISGLIIACAMIARKMWLLRTGKILVGTYEEADWTDLSIENIRSYLVEIAKIAIHKTVLLSLKTWILFTHFIRRTDKHVKTKLVNMIHKNGRYTADANQKPSEFLQGIKQHKDKIREEDRRNETS